NGVVQGVPASKGGTVTGYPVNAGTSGSGNSRSSSGSSTGKPALAAAGGAAGGAVAGGVLGAAAGYAVGRATAAPQDRYQGYNYYPLGRSSYSIYGANGFFFWPGDVGVQVGPFSLNSPANAPDCWATAGPMDPSTFSPEPWEACLQSYNGSNWDGLHCPTAQTNATLDPKYYRGWYKGHKGGYKNPDNCYEHCRALLESQIEAGAGAAECVDEKPFGLKCWMGYH
ncbi:MAG: hypothetical protein M1838_004210, partial [Thelocarpon superellum]